MTTTTTSTCDACGSTIHPAYTDCHSCPFWVEQFATPGGLIIDGEHYRIGDEPSPEDLASFPKFYGSYGREFRIQFADGREVVTHNLWHQGRIPPGLARPDNAEFVREQR